MVAETRLNNLIFLVGEELSTTDGTWAGHCGCHDPGCCLGFFSRLWQILRRDVGFGTNQGSDLVRDPLDLAWHLHDL